MQAAGGRPFFGRGIFGKKRRDINARGSGLARDANFSMGQQLSCTSSRERGDTCGDPTAFCTSRESCGSISCVGEAKLEGKTVPDYYVGRWNEPSNTISLTIGADGSFVYRLGSKATTRRITSGWCEPPEPSHIECASAEVQ